MSTAEQTRAAGWYWVRRYCGWTVGEWSRESKCWNVTGSSYPFHDSDMSEIDERRIERQEAMPVYRETQS